MIAPATQKLDGFLVALCFAVFISTVGATAKAAPQPPNAERTVKKKHSTKVKSTTQKSTSEESKAERDRRMYRECKGRPNAGACLGYTSR
nr:hypothetical protein [Acidovorax sp. SUPP3334]